MYNTNFKVKYHEIEEELVYKLKVKDTDTGTGTDTTATCIKADEDDSPDLEYEYSNQDIIDICHKLYIDEICSVFYTENILDDKIDQGMKYVVEKMVLNPDFKSIVDQMKELLYFNAHSDSVILSEEHKNNLRENSDFIIIVTLFSEQLFYITHKCVCQQINTGHIDNELLNELNQHTIKVLTL